MVLMIGLLVTAFQTPHVVPKIGIGFGPGMPWSEKYLNVDVTYLLFSNRLTYIIEK